MQEVVHAMQWKSCMYRGLAMIEINFIIKANYEIDSLKIKPFLHAKKGCIMVSLEKYDQEKISKMPLIELAKIMMLEERKALKFSEVFKKVADLKGLSEEERTSKIGQFYTDLNADGSFVSNGSNTWGLKRWYLEEQKLAEAEESTIKMKRKASGDEELNEDFEEIDLSIDDIDIDIDYEDEEDMEFDEGFDEDFEVDFGDESDEYNDK